MAEYVLSCCSTADLTKEHFEKRGIRYVCFHYSLDGKDYPDDLGQTMPFSDFYQKLVDGADAKSSQVSAGEYVEHFKKILKEGKDILHLAMSSGLSGTHMSANAAADIVRGEFPDRKIIIVDSLAASSGYGLFMDRLADLRDEGKSIEEVRDWAEANKLTVHHWFFSSDLTFFIKGGRISKTAGAIGGMLGICPLMNVDNTGHLIPRAKIRPKKKVIIEIVKKMEENAEGGLDYSGKCYISQSACYEDARAVADLIEKKFPKLNGPVEINDIGTTIGTHTGPGTVALFFFGTKRED